MKKQNLTVGEALNQADESQKARRAQWPDGIHLIVQKGIYPIDAPAVEMISGIHPKHFEFGEAGCSIELPFFQMSIHDSLYKIGLPQEDILAQDWEIV